MSGSDPKAAWPAGAVMACMLALGGASSARAQECIGFLDRSVLDAGTSGVESVVVEDLDGDGDLDVATASYGDGRLTWFENTTGGFERRTIETSAPGASSIDAVDFDGDGDLDLLATVRGTNQVLWYENDGVPENPGFTRRVVSSQMQVPLDAVAADVDSDGDLDIVSASFADDSIAFFESNGAATPLFTRRIVATTADGAAAVAVGDLDGDDVAEIVSASRLDGTIAFYAWSRDDGVDPPVFTFTREVIDETFGGADAVRVADLDGDGDLDIAAAALGDGVIAWFENDGSAPPAFARHDLATGRTMATDVFVTDLDGDGDLDLLAAVAGLAEVDWFDNQGGDPTVFVRRSIATDMAGAQAVGAGDLDGDGEVDVAAVGSRPGPPVTDDRVAWFRNLGGLPPAFEGRTISGSSDGALAVALADLDGDTHLDVATVGRPDKVAWHRNDGAAAPAFDERVLVSTANEPSAIVAADLDGNLAPDLVIASSGDGRILAYENGGGASPVFAERELGAGFLPGRIALHAADLDGDGDVDLLSAAEADDLVAWYENDGAATQPSFTRHTLATTALAPRSIATGDLDGDGDLDVAVASSADDSVAWYESDLAVTPPAIPPDTPTFSEHVLSTTADGATGVAITDLDGDGDLDVLAASVNDRRVRWFENDGASPPVFTPVDLAASNTSITAVAVGDFNADTRPDVLVTLGGSARFVWLENDASDPPVFPQTVVASGAIGVGEPVPGDLNGDGALDVAAGLQFRIAWYESAGETCQTFDADGDAMIDGTELVWLARAFGLSSADPMGEWWFAIDFNADGRVDGEDLAILGSAGVFGAAIDDCYYVCGP